MYDQVFRRLNVIIGTYRQINNIHFSKIVALPNFIKNNKS